MVTNVVKYCLSQNVKEKLTIEKKNNKYVKHLENFNITYIRYFINLYI